MRLGRRNSGKGTKQTPHLLPPEQTETYHRRQLPAPRKTRLTMASPHLWRDSISASSVKTSSWRRQHRDAAAAAATSPVPSPSPSGGGKARSVTPVTPSDSLGVAPLKSFAKNAAGPKPLPTKSRSGLMPPKGVSDDNLLRFERMASRPAAVQDGALVLRPETLPQQAHPNAGRGRFRASLIRSQPKRPPMLARGGGGSKGSYTSNGSLPGVPIASTALMRTDIELLAKRAPEGLDLDSGVFDDAPASVVAAPKSEMMSNPAYTGPSTPVPPRASALHHAAHVVPKKSSSTSSMSMGSGSKRRLLPARLKQQLQLLRKLSWRAPAA